MSAYDGIGYYYDYLGLQRENFLVQFNSGDLNNYSGMNHAEFTRSAASGLQVISGASGLNSSTNRWSHFFVYNKTTSGNGVLFSNFQGAYPYSGYTIGVTDDHKLYFESYDNNGPVVKVGSYINSNHNAVAVTKSNSVVSFNYFDFNAGKVNTESFPVQDKFVLPSNVAYLGGAINYPPHSSAANFPGNIETYAYMTECFNTRDLDSLFSGFYSYYDYAPGEVTSYSYTQVTGYEQVPYGYSGITGYQTVYGQIGTGKSGVVISGYHSVPLSGFISGGYNTVPLSGTVTVYQTGDATYSQIIDSEFASSFSMNGVAIYPSLLSGEYDHLFAASRSGYSYFNEFADYDAIKRSFELDTIHSPSDVSIFVSGYLFANQGSAVTGNVYSSGYQISGDYFINNFDIIFKMSGLGRSTEVVYDVMPDCQQYSITLPPSRTPPNSFVSNEAQFFFNGRLLESGIDYNINGPTFNWLRPQSFSGKFTSLTPSEFESSVTGTNFNNSINFQRNTSRLFANGKRLTLNEDYVENSSFDFLRGRTILETGLSFLYNNDNNYFES